MASVDHQDPDLKNILAHGQLFIPGKSGVSVQAVLGKDHQCHWNASDLFKSGKADSVVTGYVLDGDRMIWRQHSWGMKGNRILETTEGNLGSAAYFGVRYSGKEAQAFARNIGPRPKIY